MTAGSNMTDWFGSAARPMPHSASLPVPIPGQKLGQLVDQMALGRAGEHREKRGEDNVKNGNIS
jgi:hypothetical protein